MNPFHKVVVIVNPVAGRDEPIINRLNRAFQPYDIEWDVEITGRNRSAHGCVDKAIADGVDLVAVYGGDGTVMEVASALIGKNIPMAILPGGTANVALNDLGIPNQLSRAAELICKGGTIRQIDMGILNEKHFLLNAGCGFVASVVKESDRNMKNQFGSWAYYFGGVRAFIKRNKVKYTVQIDDGEPINTQGIACFVLNMGTLGGLNQQITSGVDPGDGLLDIFVLRTDLRAPLSVMSNMFKVGQSWLSLQGWRGKSADVTTSEPQMTQIDGELLGETPMHIEVIPQAIPILVPQV